MGDSVFSVSPLLPPRSEGLDKTRHDCYVRAVRPEPACGITLVHTLRTPRDGRHPPTPAAIGQCLPAAGTWPRALGRSALGRVGGDGRPCPFCPPATRGPRSPPSGGLRARAGALAPGWAPRLRLRARSHPLPLVFSGLALLAPVGSPLDQQLTWALCRDTTCNR